MTKDEALQMCLEYIETDAHERKYVRHAIKKALEQPVQEPVRIYDYVWPQRDEHKEDCVYACSYTPGHHLARGELLAVVHPSQLKNAYLQRDDEDTPLNVAAPPAAQPAPVQEPIGYAVPTFDFDNSVIKKVHYAGTVPVYTTPPAAQRPWVGLTDEEFQTTRNRLSRQDGWDCDSWDLALKEAIEAKLKEKNNG